MKEKSSIKTNTGIHLKLVILFMTMILLGSFWLSVRESLNPVSIVVTPLVTREGEPIVVTFKMVNPLPERALPTNYQFYANGVLLTTGDTILLPNSYEVCHYAYESKLHIGEQLNFVVRTQSGLGNYEKVLSLPSYPPQIWSSFVSFASFSTSLMTSMNTMTYYQSNFGSEIGFNLGMLFSVVIIGLLIFLELSQAMLRDGSFVILGRLRLRFGTVTWILLIIFLGILYTKVVMVLSVR